MARTNETSGSADPRVGGRLAHPKVTRRVGGTPANGAAVSLAEPLLDCEGAAALLSVRTSWVRDAARLGHLPCLRVGRHMRFTRAMLEDWLAGQFAGGSPNGRPRGQAPGAPRVKAGAFRRRTEAALLASLAETPKSKGQGD